MEQLFKETVLVKKDFIKGTSITHASIIMKALEQSFASLRECLITVKPIIFCLLLDNMQTICKQPSKASQILKDLLPCNSPAVEDQLTVWLEDLIIATTQKDEYRAECAKTNISTIVNNSAHYLEILNSVQLLSITSSSKDLALIVTRLGRNVINESNHSYFLQNEFRLHKFATNINQELQEEKQTAAEAEAEKMRKITRLCNIKLIEELFKDWISFALHTYFTYVHSADNWCPNERFGKLLGLGLTTPSNKADMFNEEDKELVAALSAIFILNNLSRPHKRGYQLSQEAYDTICSSTATYAIDLKNKFTYPALIINEKKRAFDNAFAKPPFCRPPPGYFPTVTGNPGRAYNSSEGNSSTVQIQGRRKSHELEDGEIQDMNH